MKPNPALPLHLKIPFFHSVAAFACMAMSSAHAATFYWDNTNVTGSFGTAGAGGATWAQGSTSPTSGTNKAVWSTSSTGSVAGNVTQATTANDIFNFGSGTTALGGGTITVSGSVNMGNTNFNSTSGAIVLSGGTINYGDARTITVNNTTNTINSVVGGATTSLTKAGAGTLVFGGANTYTGTTIISAGTLALDGAGSIASSSTIIVGATTTFDVSTVTGGYSLGAAQTLSGTGTVAGAMSVSGTLSPGSSPGILATASQTWLDGGDYNWQVLDTTGVAGTGFDQIAVTGTLDLTSLTAGGFNLNLWSLASTGPDVNGDALNFNNALLQSWTILTTTGGITGFDAADFIINVGANNGAAGFSNALAGGSFSLGTASNNLVLTFTPVPEPRAALLGSLGVLALLRRRR